MTIGMMRCGALKGSSQIEHAMWELSGVFSSTMLRKPSKLQSSSKTCLLNDIDDFFEKLSLYGIVLPVVEQNSRQFTRRSIQALTFLPDSFVQKPGKQSRSKRSLFAFRRALSCPTGQVPTSCLQPPIFMYSTVSL
jgi:hypothetical protein